MTTIFAVVLVACAQAFASVGDFKRTVVSTKLNGWDGVQFIRWEKGSGGSAGRGWAVKFDLTKGYRLRTQLGDAAHNRATVGAMAECVADAEGVSPIVGMNADYFDTGSTVARPTGLVITDDALATAGWPKDTAPEMCYIMQTADGNLVHSKLLRNAALPKGYPSASWQVAAPNGRKIRQAVRTNYCNYPVKGGKINPVGGSSVGATFPTTIGNMQSRTQYPRPLIGIGTNAVGVATNLVLFINDGRQSGWSIDFPDVDAYQIMIDEGCNEVGEFDGGGSAAMWMAFGEDSEYNFGTDHKTAHGNYVNRPSDGSPRMDACGIFILPPRETNCAVEVNDGNLYADMDGAFVAVAPGDAVKVRANTVFAAGTVPRSCTITAVDPAKVECAALSVPSGVRVLIRDVAFEKNATASVLTVAAGGTAAVAGGVGVAKIVTADASGFEVADALTGNVVVDCAAAGAAGQTFGKSSLSVGQVENSLGRIRHPSDPTLVAKAVAGANGTELVWKFGATFGGISDAEGFNYSNRLVTVSVREGGGAVSDDVKLRLVVSDMTGARVATIDRALSGTGEYAFDTAEADGSVLLPGRNYAYDVSFVDSKGDAIPGADSIGGMFLTASDGDWFRAFAKDDSEVGGTWEVKPPIGEGVYELAAGAAYAFAPTEAKDGVLRVTMEVRFAGGHPGWRLESYRMACEDNPPKAFITMKERDDETLVWAGLVRENGKLVFKEFTNVPARAECTYRCVQEYDCSTVLPRVSYLLAEGDGEAVRLADASGATWFGSPDMHGGPVSRVELEGAAKMHGLVGTYADKSLLKVDGKTITLLTNVIVDPAQLENGEYTVDKRGKAFRWTDNGKGIVYDGATGKYKVLADLPKNGYSSYVSYLLNCDAEDPGSRPIAIFDRDGSTGETRIRMALANGKPFSPRSPEETGRMVKVALEAADTVTFSGSVRGERTAPEAFAPAIDMTTRPQGFYRCRIYFDE